MTHLKFREQLVLYLVLSHEENTEIRCVPRGWPSTLEFQKSRIEVKHSLRWQEKNNVVHCAK
jgi:hypothetical protein